MIEIIEHFKIGYTIHPKCLIEENEISIFTEVSFIWLKLPTSKVKIAILLNKTFIDILEKKHKGMIFCQVKRVPIVLHEIDFDILISQKWKGLIAIFIAIKTLTNKLMLLLFSKFIIFSRFLQENRQISKKAEANDWIRKYIKKYSFFFLSSSNKNIQMNIIDLNSKIIHKKIKE